MKKIKLKESYDEVQDKEVVLDLANKYAMDLRDKFSDYLKHRNPNKVRWTNSYAEELYGIILEFTAV